MQGRTVVVASRMLALLPRIFWTVYEKYQHGDHVVIGDGFAVSDMDQSSGVG